MLLAFDVGNTNIVLGVFEEGKMITNWRLETDNNKSADEYGMIIGQLFKYEGLEVEDVKDVIISTVVPSVHSSAFIGEIFSQESDSYRSWNKDGIGC